MFDFHTCAHHLVTTTHPGLPPPSTFNWHTPPPSPGLVPPLPSTPPPTSITGPSTYVDFHGCAHMRTYFGHTTFNLQPSLFPQPTSLASQHWSPGVLSVLLEWPAGSALLSTG